jgi:hypothetical protein
MNVKGGAIDDDVLTMDRQRCPRYPIDAKHPYHFGDRDLSLGPAETRTSQDMQLWTILKRSRSPGFCPRCRKKLSSVPGDSEIGLLNPDISGRIFRVLGV